MNWKAHIESLIDAGATPGSIAGLIGVTPNAIREIRAGRTKAPRADAALRLSALTPDMFRVADLDANRIEAVLSEWPADSINS